MGYIPVSRRVDTIKCRTLGRERQSREVYVDGALVQDTPEPADEPYGILQYFDAMSRGAMLACKAGYNVSKGSRKEDCISTCGVPE